MRPCGSGHAVAIGLGEGGEFYQPLAIAIIGGTITSTILTLLMVPTFYDSIEISRDRMVAKFKRRLEKRHVLLAFLQTFFEALFTLLLLRFFYRMVMKPVRGEVEFRKGGRKFLNVVSFGRVAA